MLNMAQIDKITTGKSQQASYEIYYGTEQEILQFINNEQFEVGEPYPNPFNRDVMIPIYATEDDSGAELTVRMVDMQGRIVYEGNHTLTQGYQEVIIGTNSTLELQAGMYQVLLQSDGGINNLVRIIKQK